MQIVRQRHLRLSIDRPITTEDLRMIVTEIDDRMPHASHILIEENDRRVTFIAVQNENTQRPFPALWQQHGDTA